MKQANSIRNFIPLCEPRLGGNEWRYVKECLDSGWVSSAGPFVGRFEKAFAGYAGAKEAVAVASGTAALHIALLAAGLKPGEEVLVPNLTFIAPVNAVRYAGGHPVLMDADPRTWQIDPAKVERFLEEECEVRGEVCVNKQSGRVVRILLPVHLLGLACEMERLCALAGRFRLKVVEDACEGLGVRLQGRHIGTFGEAGAFSFNGNKVMTTGGGGMVVVREKGRADYARYLTTQAKDDPLEYFHNEVGFNYRLSNLHAALGLAQIEQLEGFLGKKRSVAAYYGEALQKIPGLTLMPNPTEYRPSFWLYTILLDEKTSLDRRKLVVRKLNEQGVGARPFWHTVHDLPPYRDAQRYRIEHSIRLYERGISLPSDVSMTPEELEKVVECLKNAL